MAILAGHITAEVTSSQSSTTSLCETVGEGPESHEKGCNGAISTCNTFYH